MNEQPSQNGFRDSDADRLAAEYLAAGSRKALRRPRLDAVVGLGPDEVSDAGQNDVAENREPTYSVIASLRPPRIGNRGPGAWQTAFLDVLSATASVARACAACGVSRSAVYAARHADSDFAEAWQLALDCLADSLESVLYQRALQKSDQAAIFLLKRLRPEYRQPTQAKPGSPLTLTLDDVARARAARSVDAVVADAPDQP